MAAHHHSWGKAARHHESDEPSHNIVAEENSIDAASGAMEVDEDEEDDTLVIRPTIHSKSSSSSRATSGHRRDNYKSSRSGDMRSLLSKERRRDRSGDRRRSEKRRSEKRDRGRDREREEGEHEDISSEGSRNDRHASPGVGPNVAEAVQSETGGAAQEKTIRERLEKLAQERAAREKQLQEELKKRGQDFKSPAQKAKVQKRPESNDKKNSADKTQKDDQKAEEKKDESLKKPSRGMSTFIEEPEISSPESVIEEAQPDPATKSKKSYGYSKFGDLDDSDRSRSPSPSRSRSPRSYSKSPSRSRSFSPNDPSHKMTTMQRFLNERMDSSSRDGMSPAAIAKRAVQELKNSPGQGAASPSSMSGFASSTFNELFTDRPYEDSPRFVPPEIAALPPYFPALSGCRSVEEFECVNRIDEGTYGVVYRAKEKKTNEMVALKRLKMEKEREGFPITSLREIATLLKAQHPNIVTVREIVVGSNMDKIYIVMDFVEHDLKALMESMKTHFLPGEVKTLMIQLLRGVTHMHENWIIHRDLKTSNLLLSHRGVLKIGDFGLAREYGSPLKPYTQVVVTLWYRSPELLLGTKMYSTAVDMWSCGCIFAELVNRKPLFPGRTEMEQLNKIFQILGTPNEKIWPGLVDLPGWKRAAFSEQPYNSLRNKFDKGLLSSQGFQLMNSFLTYNPERRITGNDALKHEYFRENPFPVPPSMFPTWPAKSEGGKKPKAKKQTTPRAPEAGVGAYAKLLGEDDDEEQFKLTAAQGPSLLSAKP